MQDIKMKIRAVKTIVFFILCLAFSGNMFLTDSGASDEDSWKNFYGVTWKDEEANQVAYAKQMGYEYIVVRQKQYTDVGKYAAIKGKLSGMKFYLSNPHFYYETGSHGDHYHLRDINTSSSYTQEQKDWYTQNKVCKNSESFPANLASGSFSSSTQFVSVWDFQQQAVIDKVIDDIITAVKKYQDAIPGFIFSGYVIDVPMLSGDFKIWENSTNKSVKLSDVTGGNNSCVNPNHAHAYVSVEEGIAAFYKDLHNRLKAEFPDNDIKWIINPYYLYNASSVEGWIDKIKDRADKNELTPDMILQRGASTDFVDNANNFNSGVAIAKENVGLSQRSKINEYENRLYAAKAGLNGAWYDWYGQWGSGIAGSSNMPNFQRITEVYPRLKLIRCIPNWDNLNAVPLSERSYSGGVYQSKKDGELQSYISADLMYSRQPKTGKLFVVFNTHNGVIKLNANEVTGVVQKTDGYFAEAGDAGADMEVSDNSSSGLKEIRLKSGVGIPVDGTNNETKGVGYIITIKTLPEVTTNLAGNVKSAAVVLNATVNANGSSTSAYFEYGTASGVYTNQTQTQTVNGSSDTSISASLSGLSEGKSYYYRITAKNDAGTAYGGEISFNVPDVSAPSGCALSLNDTAEAVNSSKITLKLTAQDNLGVSGYYLSTRSNTPAASNSGWVSFTPITRYSASISYTLVSGDGLKTLYCWFKDSAGNISKPAKGSIILDTTDPVISITLPVSSANIYSTKAGSLTLSGTASDTASGIKAVSWSSGAGEEGGAAQGTTNWSIANISLKQGDSTITVSAQDKAGNTASASFMVVYGSEPGLSVSEAADISSTSATLTGSVNPNGLSTSAYFEYGTASGVYTNQTQTQTVNGSSDTSISASLSGLSEGKSYYYRMAAMNSSGTVYSSKMSFTTLDASRPSGSISINNGLAAVNTTEVTLKLTAEDNIGVAGYYLSSGYAAPKVTDSGWVSLTPVLAYSAKIEYNLSAEEGTKTIYCWYKDSAGNISKVSSCSIILDTTSPSLSITNPVIEVGAAYYVASGNIFLKGTSRDEASGVENISYSVNNGSFKTAQGTSNWSISDLSLKAGENIVTLSTKDKADNSVSLSITVIYGSSPAVTTGSSASITTASAVLNSKVNPHNLDTTVYFEYGKAHGSYTQKSSSKSILAGSTDTSVSLDISALTENITYYYRALAQNAQGIAYGDEKTFKTAEAADTIAPVGTLSINANAKHTKSRTVSLDLSATDNKGVTGYYISSNNITPLSTASGWTAVDSVTNYSAKINYILSSGDGLKTIYCWFRDSAGNISMAQ